MEQQVEVTVTLSIDVNLSKKGIEARFKELLQIGDTHDNGITVMEVTNIKEEAEIYNLKKQ